MPISTISDLTAHEVRKLLDYDPETGLFRWRHREDVRPRWNTRYAGTVAGTLWRSRARNKTGYIMIVIRCRSYRAHRLAWLYMTGEWPEDEIDHRNQNGTNNRWRNLRAATQSQNKANVPSRSHNRLGIKGVREVPSGRFVAAIKVPGRRRYLGTFDTAEEAHQTYASEPRANDMASSPTADYSAASITGSSPWTGCLLSLSFRT